MEIWHDMIRLTTIGIFALLVGCGGDPTAAPIPEEEPGFTATERTPVVEASVGYPARHPMGELEAATEDGPAEDQKLGVDPEVISVSPDEGHAMGGDIVTIEGERFADGAAVFFGDVPSEDVFFISDRFVNATVPPGDPGLVTVRVTNPDGAEGELIGAFLYYDDLEVHSVAPAVGHPRGGEPITVTGRGFEPGVLVLVGDRLALDVAVGGGDTLTAITPPGVLGPVDVRVLLEGHEVALLSDGYTYGGGPEIEQVWPPHGATVGGSTVEVKGRWFTANTTVSFAGKPAQVTGVSEDGTTLVAIIPGGPAGPADVAAVQQWGEDTLEDGFTWLAPATGGISVWNVLPGSGSATGGYSAMIVAQGFDPGKPITVSFGTMPAAVEAADLYPYTLVVTVPAGDPGPVDVELAQGIDVVVLEDGFEYTEPLAVVAVEPEVLPAIGGQVVIEGEGFESGPPQVWIGAIEADSTSVLNDTQLLVDAGACSPGPLDVTVAVDDREATLTGGLECVTGTAHVFAVDPPTSSQAGGGLVKVIGSGLPTEATVRFGGLPGTETWTESQLVVWTRVPRGDVGAVDVELSGPDAASGLLRDGLEYIDTANKKAGIWGLPIDRTVNVSVFDSSNGKRLEGATAIIGSDAQTKYQCVTDDRGQCVISYPEMKGTYTITAARKNYSAYTIAGFGGTNVTIYIRPQDPPIQQGPPGPPGAVISVNNLTGEIHGTLHGVGKYVKPPPPNCALIGSPDGKQCTPCDQATPCADDLMCEPLADTGSWCLAPCADSEECADGFMCATLGQGPVCMPYGGKLQAQCATSRRNFFGTNPDPGPGQYVELNEGTFEITSRIGEVTVYCIAGYLHPTTEQFIPSWMGIRPTVVVGLDQTITDIDVELTIPLHRTLRQRVFDLPESEGGIGSLSYRNAVDVGAEGWIPLADEPTWSDGEMRYFVGYPESAKVFHEDAAFTFYTTVAQLGTDGPSPQSSRLAYRLDSVAGEPVQARDADLQRWDPAETGMGGDLSGLWGSGAENVWGVGPDGRLVHRGPLGWSPQPHFTDVDLNGIHGTAVEDIVAVGDSGTILEFDGATWTPAVVAAPIAWDLQAVHGDWAVGDGGIVHREDGIWSHDEVLHSGGLKGVVSYAGTAWTVGDGGKVLEWVDGGWSTSIVVPSLETLHAIATDGEELVAVGDNGVIVTRSVPGGDWSVAESPTRRHLWAVTFDEDGAVYAAGTAGTVLRREGGVWFDESQDGAVRLEVRSMWAGDGQVLAAGFSAVPIGPWMAFPDPLNPRWYGFMEKTHFEFDFLDGGPDPTFNSLYLSSADGFTVWAVVARGDLSYVELPRLVEVIGYDPVPIGQKYFNVTRALNPAFSMDSYRFNHLSMWRRTTWSAAFGTFY